MLREGTKVITTRTFHGAAQLLAVLVFSLALAACGGGGGGGSASGNGGSQPPVLQPPVFTPTNGSTKFSIALEAAGTNCTEGGVAVLAGLDANSNNVFDAGEMSGTRYSCFVTPGAAGTASTAGMATLVALSAEAVGANCTLGGRKVAIGFDANANGVLDTAEIASTQFFCSSATVTATGNDTLATVTNKAIGSLGFSCAFGGRQVITSGNAIPVDLCNATNPGAVTFWARIKGLATQALAGVAQIVDSLTPGTVDVTLPVAPNVGDVFRFRGESDNAWRIAQSADQTIGTRALPGGVAPGSNFVAGTNSTHNWWFAASSASGQKLAAVGNNYQPLHPLGATASGTVWTSINGGLNWTEVTGPTAPPSSAWASIASSADGTKLAVVGVSVGIYTSGDSGVTWTHTDLPDYYPNTIPCSNVTVGNGICSAEFVSVSMTPDGSRMVASTLYSTSGGADGRIFTYEQPTGATFGTGAWTRQPDLTSVHQWRGVAMSADGKTLVGAAFIDGSVVDAGAYVSRDFGKTWVLGTPGSPDRSAYRVAVSADGTRMIMAERFGKIFTSSNSGASWSTGIFEGGFNAVACSADGLTMMAVQASGFAPGSEGPNPPAGRDGKLLVSTNGGTSFIDRSVTPRWYRGAAMSADGNRLVAAVDGGPIFVSTSNRTGYGVAGSLTGGKTNDLTLRYLGSGLFDATAASGPAFTVQ
jgi:hypothetical protein